ncbi:MAG: flagellar basal-body MS-ring/collar protein FliF [Succinivibrio sp.]
MADNDLPVPTGAQAPGSGVPAVTGGATGTAVAAAGQAAPAASAAEASAAADSGAGAKQGAFRRFIAFLSDFIHNGDVLHRIMLLGFLAIFLAVIIFTVFSLHGGSSSAPATERQLGTYSPQEIGKVLDFLDNGGYKYRLSGEAIFVDASKYSDITSQMLRQGIALPKETNDIGDSILMTDSGFGVSQHLENERIKHGREIQLARAIEKIDGIDRATVLLAIPKENVFAREKSRPSAAVVVTLKNGAYLSPENVSSIRFMVASAVHDLLSKDVTVTDQQGRLLSDDRRDDSAENKLQREFEMHTMREAQYRDKLDTILAPMLGLGNYSAEVDVTLDTTKQEETAQLYNPDSQAVRSETLKEQQGGNDKGNPYGVPGSLSNQPPANAAIPQQLRNGTANESNQSSDQQRKESREAVRNYEVDTTVRHTVRPTNIVQRLTVSVAVDYLRKIDADGNVTYVPRPKEDLEKIADLVRGGLGLDQARGDFVNVETVSFPHNDERPPLPWYRQNYFYRLVRVLGAVLVIIVLVVFVIRPMLMKLLHREEEEADLEEQNDVDLDDGSALEGNDDLDLITKNKEMEDQVYSINDSGGIDLPDLHKEADLLKAVRTLASNEPQLTAEVIKEWLEGDSKDKTAEKKS